MLTTDIISGKHGITAETGLHRWHFFSISDGWWLQRQAKYNTEMAKDTMADVSSKIHPQEPIAV
ncbi:MAG: hypothetical protein PHP85_08115 [Gallionella sp.]|nr:hypothetical protein [Gallionella sp.]